MSAGDRQPSGRSSRRFAPQAASRIVRWRTSARFVLRVCVGGICWGVVGAACTERARAVRSDPGEWRPGGPNIAPEMVNDELPFRYPVDLYVQRVQGNVLLRLHVDSNGVVIPDST